MPSQHFPHPIHLPDPSLAHRRHPLVRLSASTAGRSCGTGFTQVAVANQWLLGLKRDGSVSILGKGDLLGAFATFDPLAVALLCLGLYLGVEAAHRRHRGELDERPPLTPGADRLRAADRRRAAVGLEPRLLHDPAFHPRAACRIAAIARP